VRPMATGRWLLLSPTITSLLEDAPSPHFCQRFRSANKKAGLACPSPATFGSSNCQRRISNPFRPCRQDRGRHPRAPACPSPATR
jgi:hypothetical protein